MAKSKPLTIEDPETDYTFAFDTKIGTFRFRLLTVSDDIKVQKLAEILYGGPMPDDTEARSTAFVIAELEIACDAAPEGWSWQGQRNRRAYSQIWQKYLEVRNSFRDGFEADSIFEDTDTSAAD